MNYKEHFKKNFSLAYPVMLSQMGQVMVGVADSVMVGRVGVEPLAAASLSNSIFGVIMMFGIGVSYAITPLVAQADGAGDHRENAILLKHGLFVNMSVSVVLFLLLMTATQVMHLLNQPEEVVALAVPYLTIIACSLLPFMLFQTFRQFCEGLSLTQPPMYITLAANLLNIALNYIFIFGKLGLEPMGLVGAGWATLISRILMGLGIVGYVWLAQRFKQHLTGFSLVKIAMGRIKKLLNLGIPAGLQFIFEVGAFATAAVMAGWLGAEPLAAHQIAINLSSISYMMATGISAASTIRIGNQMGRKNIPMLIKAGRSSFIMGASFMAFCGLVFIIGKNVLPALYIDEQSVVIIAASLLVIAAFFQISDGLQVVALGTLRGMEDVKIPTLITLVAYWVVGLPTSYLLGFPGQFGIQGIWYGLLIGLSLSAIMLLLRFHFLTKEKLSYFSKV
ncbi:MATE family efflux transporter [Fulvivirgaceae bacterium BMA12]|uniref:Multidrug-efflux transporter n=1 Tax=Agaribacillus aureus TaxID=3051825 RepID=A0ABT8LFN9_9BACT|nr:MATE family efflux transporter [Fulvivirgaceae bacterium BMA12]